MPEFMKIYLCIALINIIATLIIGLVAGNCLTVLCRVCYLYSVLPFKSFLDEVAHIFAPIFIPIPILGAVMLCISTETLRFTCKSKFIALHQNDSDPLYWYRVDVDQLVLEQGKKQFSKLLPGN